MRLALLLMNFAPLVIGEEACGIIERAEMLETGNLVEIVFAGATDQGMMKAGEKFPCAQVITVGEDCYFADSSLLYATTTEALPGTVVSVVPGSIGVLNADCFVNEVSIVLQEEIPVHLILEAPDEIAQCEEFLVVDARQTTGSGGRSLTYELEGVSYTSPSAGLFHIPLIDTLDLSLRVTNFLGMTDTVSKTVAVRNQPIPNLRIIGASSRTIFRPNVFTINAKAEATSCQNRTRLERGVKYEWRIYQDDEIYIIENESNDPRSLRLSSYVLNASQTYIVEVSATDESTGLTATATATVYVQPSDLVPRIAGGSRTVAVDTPLQLVANASYDPDDICYFLSISPTLAESEYNRSRERRQCRWTQFIYRWTCRQFSMLEAEEDNDEEEAEPCGNGLALSFGPVLNIPADSLSLDYRYNISLEISSIEAAQRTATTSILLETIATSQATVWISGASTTNLGNANQIVANKRLTIQGAVSTEAEGILAWTLETGALQSDLPLSSYLSTPVQKNVGRQDNTSLALALPVGALIPGGKYRFRLLATVDNRQSSAFIDLEVAQPPSGGILQVEPASGFALETLFKMQTYGWAGNEPLLFRFNARMGDNLFKVLRSDSLSTVLDDVTLFAGDPVLPLFVVATNTLGATGEAKTFATVESSQMSFEALQETSLKRIEEAFVFFEREAVCQISVATAFETNDFSLRQRLVKNLDEAWELYDITNDQIAEFMTAFVAPLNPPTSITKIAAVTALERTRSVATRLSEVTEVDVSLDSLTSADMALIVSNLLESELFNTTNSTDENFTAAANIGFTLDALALVRLRDRAQDEAEDLLQASNLQIATRRISGLETISLPVNGTNTLDFRRLQKVEDVESYQGGVEVPALGQASDISLTELLRTPYQSISAGTILRLTLRSLASADQTSAEDDFGSTELTLAIPQIEPLETQLEPQVSDFATVNVSCDWGYEGPISAICPLDDDSIITAQCNGTGGDMTLSCTERSQTQCARYDRDMNDWNTECRLDTERSTSEIIYCLCETLTTGDPTEFSSIQETEAFFKANFRGFIGSGFDEDRAFVMLIFFGVYIIVAGILCCVGHLMDKHDLKKYTFLRNGSSSIGAPPQPEKEMNLQTSLGLAVASRSLKQREAHRIILERLLKDGPRAWRDKWFSRFYAALYHRHPLSSVWLFSGKYGTPRSKRLFILSVEIVMLMSTVAIENALQYPDPGCADRKSRSRCRKFESVSGRKLCQWRESSGDCEYRGPPADDFGRIEHFTVVIVAVAILLPVIILFEKAYLGVIDKACWSYQFGCHALFRGSDKEIDGGAPAVAELDESHHYEKHSIQVMTNLPDEKDQGTIQRRRSSVSERVITVIAAKSDAYLWLEAQSRATGVAEAVLLRRKELQAAMTRAHSEHSARGGRAVFILHQLENELMRKWRVSLPINTKELEANVTVVIYRMLLKARSWGRDLAAIDATDEELKALYIAHKAQTALLSRAERRIYERAAIVVTSENNPRRRRNLFDIEEPSRILFFASLLFTIAAIVAPAIWLIIYASDVGRRETSAFYVDVVFEFCIVFGVVFPLQIWIRFVIMPAIVAEKVDRLATLPESVPRAYPFQTPLNDDAIDYLLEDYPNIKESIQNLETPVRATIGIHTRNNTLALKHNASKSIDEDSEDDDDGIDEFAETKEEDKMNASIQHQKEDLSLEELEKIYDTMSWRPLWTSTIVFFLLRAYMVLPPVFQELAIEVSVLAIPFIAFAGSREFLSSDNKFNALILLIAAIVLAWTILVTLAHIGHHAHNYAHNSRQRSIRLRQQSFRSQFSSDGNRRIGDDQDSFRREYLSSASSDGTPIHAEENDLEDVTLIAEVPSSNHDTVKV